MLNTPKVRCIPSIDSFPSAQTKAKLIADGHQNQDCIRTIHSCLQIIEEPVDHFQRLDCSDPSFLLGESV